jgi:hypothetical protein
LQFPLWPVCLLNPSRAHSSRNGGVSIEALIEALNAWFRDPAEKRSLSEYLDQPRLREYINVRDLAELEESPNWDASIVPLVDGTLLVFSFTDEEWHLETPQMPHWADNR